jgi:hypothetical protein
MRWSQYLWLVATGIAARDEAQYASWGAQGVHSRAGLSASPAALKWAQLMGEFAGQAGVRIEVKIGGDQFADRAGEATGY